MSSSATQTVQPVEKPKLVRHDPGKNRLGSRFINYFRRLFGPPSVRRLARAALQIPKIRSYEREFSKLSDEEFLHTAHQMRGRARGGESLDRLLPEVFGLTSVACQRGVGLRPYDVQLAAGVVLHHAALAELATGEGKTLVAAFPVALNALFGKGVHVTTVNDYLARRDGEWTSRIFGLLGLSVGTLQQRISDDERKAAYLSDITYGTASEYGFDFLRDRLKVRQSRGQAIPFWAPWTETGNQQKPSDPKVQRGHHFALVDEADNIFIDEARTPLIISSPTRLANEKEQKVYYWSDGLAAGMTRNVHYYLDEKKQKVEITEEGRRLIRYSNPPVGEHSHAMDKLIEHVERSVQARHRFVRDQHYMVENDKVVIIDEFTGRRMPDRHWREGLHQAVEAKERVPITLAADHAAQVTYQSYFRLYTKLAGMTGTAAQNWREIRRVYKLRVVCVPTNKPCIRKHRPDRVFPNEGAKFDAVIEDVMQLHASGRPVLIGTRSVATSENLSRRLNEKEIPHEVLNARPDIADREADIVAQAGRKGGVTIATNMAGRGTDIVLGGNAEALAWDQLKEQFAHRGDVPSDLWLKTVAEIEEKENLREARQLVRELGGLHVLGTERHEAQRIDRQLQGRAARQGDPGSCQFFLSLEDELLEGLGEKRQQRLTAKGARGGKGNWQKYHPLFIAAQRRVEKRHYRQRLDLMVHERNRQEILRDLGADPYVD